jgi:tRNA dimethylallyltransferase
LLESLDPVYYNTVDRSNPVRLIRAIEVCRTAGVPYSTLRGNTRHSRPFRVLQVGITLPRQVLNQRINKRVEKMMEDGLLDEARSLHQFRDLPAMNTVGYRELFDYFEGTRTLDEAVDKIKTNTRRYAKRQITWFAKDNTITWFEPTDFEKISSFVDHTHMTA